MNDRVRRTNPLLQAKSRIVDEKRAALAAALRTANVARSEQMAAEDAWEKRVTALAMGQYETIAEHLEARTHLESLKRAAIAAADRATLAVRAEQVARESLIVAEREMKKIEAWRDGIVEAERAAEARVERLASDELSARIFQARR